MLDVCNKPVFKFVFWLVLKRWIGARCPHHLALASWCFSMEERRQETLKVSMAHEEHGEGHSLIEYSPQALKSVEGMLALGHQRVG